MPELDLQQIISQAVSFVLLLWLLKKFAWGPLLQALDARTRAVEEGYAEVERVKAKVAQLEVDLTARLAAIDAEVRTKIQEAVRDGRRVAQEIQDDARAQSQAILAKAEETIALEVAKAKVGLRDELVDIAVGAAERLLRHRVDAAADRTLTASLIDELGKGGRA